MLISEVMKRQMLLPRKTYIERVTNVPIPYGNFAKHINDFLKNNNSPSRLKPSTNYKQFSWVCGLEVLESLGLRSVSSWIKTGQSLNSLLPFDKGEPSTKYSL